MTRRGLIGLTAGLMSSAMLAEYGLFGSAFRFRLTVEVQTPQGLKSGSSVMEYEVRRAFSLGTYSNSKYDAGISHGEAVMVQLPDGPIFALIRNQSADVGEAMVKALGGPKITNDDLLTFARKMGAWGAHYSADVPRTIDVYEPNTPNWPTMVRFRNIDDPKSVELVDPDAIGVRRVWVETTRDSVTNGIEKRLVWLEKLEAASSSNVMQTFGSQLTAQLRVR